MIEENHELNKETVLLRSEVTVQCSSRATTVRGRGRWAGALSSVNSSFTSSVSAVQMEVVWSVAALCTGGDTGRNNLYAVLKDRMYML